MLRLRDIEYSEMVYQVGTTGTTSYADSGLVASTSYTYTVDAYNRFGNTSTQSQELIATTTPAAVTPPSFVGSQQSNLKRDERLVTFHAATSAGNTLVVYVIWNNTGSVALTDYCGNTS